MTIDNPETEQAARDKALKQIKKRRDFHTHVFMYLVINAFLVGIWAMTDLHGFFWPMILIVLWGIGVVLNAWDVYARRDITEDEIQREVDRLNKFG